MKEPPRGKLVRALLWLVPLWLLLSAGAAIWMYFRWAKDEEREETRKFAQSVSAERMTADLATLETRVGRRDAGDDAGRQGLTRAAAWISGKLGPLNTGYTLREISAGSDPAWPIIWARLRGKEPEKGAVWLIAGYDEGAEAAGGSRQAEALISALAAAQALAGDAPERTLHFIFVPHLYRKGPLCEGALVRLKPIFSEEPAPLTVLALEDMGKGYRLDASARDSGNAVFSIVPSSFGGKSEPPPATERPESFQDMLEAMGLPVARVSSASARQHAAEDLPSATGQLVELLRRLGMKK